MPFTRINYYILFSILLLITCCQQTNINMIVIAPLPHEYSTMPNSKGIINIYIAHKYLIFLVLKYPLISFAIDIPAKTIKNIPIGTPKSVAYCK